MSSDCGCCDTGVQEGEHGVQGGGDPRCGADPRDARAGPVPGSHRHTLPPSQTGKHQHRDLTDILYPHLKQVSTTCVYRDLTDILHPHIKQVSTTCVYRDLTDILYPHLKQVNTSTVCANVFVRKQKLSRIASIGQKEKNPMGGGGICRKFAVQSTTGEKDRIVATVVTRMSS